MGLRDMYSAGDIIEYEGGGRDYLLSRHVGCDYSSSGTAGAFLTMESSTDKPRSCSRM